MIFCRLLIFSKQTCFFFSKKCFRNTIRVSRRVAVQFVWPDLDPNCLQKLSADDSSRQGVNILQVHYSDVCKCHTVLSLSLLEATLSYVDNFTNSLDPAQDRHI